MRKNLSLINHIRQYAIIRAILILIIGSGVPTSGKYLSSIFTGCLDLNNMPIYFCHCVKYLPVETLFYQKWKKNPSVYKKSHGIKLLYRAMQRNATQRNATQRNATQRNATQRNATQRNATKRNATQRNATQVQTNTRQHRAAQRCRVFMCNYTKN